MNSAHNNKIKKEAVCYTPACEWPAAIFSQAYVPQPAPIITGVMCLMRISAAVSFCLLTLSSCSEELINFEEFRMGMTKSSIIEQFGEPLDMRKTAIMNYDAAFPIDEIPIGESPRAIVEVWNYPVLRTYGITNSTRRHETGQIELYFSDDQSTSDRITAIGWLNQEHLEAMSSDSDT